MLYHTLFLLAFTLLAGVVGFGMPASPVASIAQALFALFLVLFFATLFRRTSSG